MNPNTAPKVDTIDSILAQQAPAYQGGINVINQKQAQLPAQFEAQRMGLDAQKVQGFNDINTQANARGLAFSGIPLDEQANYLSTKYLPGLQALSQQQNEQDLALQQSLADIDRDRRLGALNTQQNQQKSLEAYLSEMRQFEQQKQMAAIDAANQRANAAYSASLQAKQSATPTPQQYLSQAFSNIGTSNANWRTDSSTENSGIIGQLAANYGYSLDEARKIAYQYRKDLYGF